MKKCNCEHRNNECNCEREEQIQDLEEIKNNSKESEYLELAQRIKAEFDNYKKRNAEVTINSYNNGVASTVTKLLPVLDSFKQAKSKITDQQVLEGIDLIYNQLNQALKELGIEKIQTKNKEFDPNLHNAVLTGVDETKPDGQILEEYQEGFTLGDKVIRHSVVRINKLNQ